MTPRTLVFSTTDIVCNYEQVAGIITQACNRGHDLFRVSGVCQASETIFFPLEVALAVQSLRYVIAPLSGNTDAHFRADIFDRWAAGFATRGSIRLSEIYLGLFEIERPRSSLAKKDDCS